MPNSVIYFLNKAGENNVWGGDELDDDITSDSLDLPDYEDVLPDDETWAVRSMIDNSTGLLDSAFDDELREKLIEVLGVDDELDGSNASDAPDLPNLPDYEDVMPDEDNKIDGESWAGQSAFDDIVGSQAYNMLSNVTELDSEKEALDDELRENFINVLGLDKNSFDDGVYDKIFLQCIFRKFCLLAHPDKAPEAFKKQAHVLLVTARGIFKGMLKDLESKKSDDAGDGDDNPQEPPTNVKAEFFDDETNPPYILVSWSETDAEKVSITWLDTTRVTWELSKGSTEVVFTSAEFPDNFLQDDLPKFVIMAVGKSGKQSRKVLCTVRFSDSPQERFKAIRNNRRNVRRELKRGASLASDAPPWKKPRC